MSHRVAGKKLGRNTNERKALFRNLAGALILHEKITTTESKAKSIKPIVEKLVTRAKVNSIHNRRILLKELPSENAVRKLLEVVGPTFKDRPGGYLRLVKLGARSGDRAEMVTLAFVEDFSEIALKQTSKESKKPTGEEEKKPTKSKPRAVKKVNDGKEKTK